jgi:hypothetical protein
MIYAVPRSPSISLGKRAWAVLGMPSKRLDVLAHGKQAPDDLGKAYFVIHRWEAKAMIRSSAFGSTSYRERVGAKARLDRKGEHAKCD